MKKIPYTFENSNLFYAADRGRIDLAREFLGKGADPNYIELGRPTLTAAVIENHVEVARLLLEHEADPNLKSDKGLTPLMEASSAEMVKLLAEYGADPKVCDGNRNNALIYFAAYDCRNAVKAWLELGWPITKWRMKRLVNNLLAKGRFEMISLLTGFQFISESSIGRIAEFKARYAV